MPGNVFSTHPRACRELIKGAPSIVRFAALKNFPRRPAKETERFKDETNDIDAEPETHREKLFKPLLTGKTTREPARLLAGKLQEKPRLLAVGEASKRRKEHLVMMPFF